MILFTTTFRRAVTTSAVTLAITFGSALTAISQAAAVTLNGAGATFPKPLYDRYIAEFSKDHNDIQINYEGIGSGGGIKQLIAGTVDFAGSDAAMEQKEIDQIPKEHGGVMFVPTAGGAVAVVYNIPGVSKLQLSRKVLPAIFDGKITRWNDPAITADNKNVNLPDQPIKTVVRADGSGTTFIFTNHLSAVDGDFKTKVGASKQPTWPGNPLKGKGNPGVAALVKQTPGSIGYVEAQVATQSGLSKADVQNQKLRFVSPTVKETETALKNIKFNDDFRVDFSKLADPADGYPIAGLTWLMFYKQYDSPEKAQAVQTLIDWIFTKGQDINPGLEYTKIPQPIAEQVNTAVKNAYARK